jgi:carbamoyl-phosphate synthase large subunit
VPIVGTSPEAIDLAEDRGAFGGCSPLRAARAPHGTATAPTRPSRSPHEIGYPVLVRPSTCSAAAAWRSSTTTRRSPTYIERATEASPEHPVLVDRFLDDAIEIDVDVLYDGTDMYSAGSWSTSRRPGIHSGDSACTLPPATLGAEIERVAPPPGHRRGHRRAGLMNVQFALAGRPLRARGQPARLAHRAVRRQGHRGAAGQGGGPDHARREPSRELREEGCCRRRATAGRCRPTRRCRSRRP